VAYDDVETPSGKQNDLLGGSATYFSLAACRFSAPRLVGVIGNDFSESDRKLLQDNGVDLTGLVHDTSGDTFRWGGRYHDNLNERTTLYTHLNVFESFQPVIPESYANSEFVFLGNIAPMLQQDVLSQATGAKFTALDTMNFWITGQREELEKVLSRVDALIINDEEALLLTDQRAVLNAARALQAKGPQTVIIKRGEHGVFLFHKNDQFYVPAFPLQNVVDPTGAGDTFAGGFMGYLARCNDVNIDTMRAATVAGSVMASYCVEGFGPSRLQSVTTDDLKTRYDKFVRMTRCPALNL